VTTDQEALNAAKRLRQMSGHTEGAFSLTGADAFRVGASSTSSGMYPSGAEDAPGLTLFDQFLDVGVLCDKGPRQRFEHVV
jgi:hypothetical protein